MLPELRKLAFSQLFPNIAFLFTSIRGIIKFGNNVNVLHREKLNLFFIQIFIKKLLRLKNVKGKSPEQWWLVC